LKWLRLIGPPLPQDLGKSRRAYGRPKLQAELALALKTQMLHPREQLDLVAIKLI
jgi:hypothetical protein